MKNELLSHNNLVFYIIEPLSNYAIEPFCTTFADIFKLKHGITSRNSGFAQRRKVNIV